jgi:transposase
VSGPGAYLPDPTEGITRPEDLPKAKVVRRSRNFKHQHCPRCGKRCPRDRVFTRVLHDLGDLVSTRPRDLHLVYSQHHCTRCRRYFTADTSEYAPPKSRYTHRVVALAVRLVVEDGLPYQAASVSGTKTCTEFTRHVWQTTDASSDSSKSIQRGGHSGGCTRARKPIHGS